MKNLVLFASGGGSSVENIAKFFQDEKKINIAAIYCNNPNAGLFKRNFLNQFKIRVFNIDELIGGLVLDELTDLEPDLIVLAGFLKKVPKEIISNFSNKIVNIHPSLLPKYGGKGMYGINVHKAVLKNNEKSSGFTIHYVTEEYDEGNIIFQKAFEIDAKTPEGLSKKILAQEHKYYPKIIKQILNV
tara:strand:- start:2697 stop:3257 length:561 start_codon:yes stop_codon:yes gene_type:complete